MALSVRELLKINIPFPAQEQRRRRLHWLSSGEPSYPLALMSPTFPLPPQSTETSYLRLPRRPPVTGFSYSGPLQQLSDQDRNILYPQAEVQSTSAVGSTVGTSKTAMQELTHSVVMGNYEAIPLAELRRNGNGNPECSDSQFSSGTSEGEVIVGESALSAAQSFEPVRRLKQLASRPPPEYVTPYGSIVGPIIEDEAQSCIEISQNRRQFDQWSIQSNIAPSQTASAVVPGQLRWVSN